jgi:CheY-like chemotaxis protein
MDVQMPILDGHSATRKIRKWEQEKGSHIPIFALTANYSKEDEKECLEAGMDSFLMKPIDKEKLLTVFSNLSKSNKMENDNKDKQCISNDNIMIIDGKELMGRMDGDMDLLSELCQIFAEDFPKMIQEIEIAIKHQEFPVLHRVAHTIKGALASLSAKSATESALRLENFARSEELNKASDEFEQLKKEVVLAQEHLKMFVQKESQCIS